MILQEARVVTKLPLNEKKNVLLSWRNKLISSNQFNVWFICHTQNQKNEASSKEFCGRWKANKLQVLQIQKWFDDELCQTWNRMKWIRDKSSSGLLNQKSSSLGLSLTPEGYSVKPAFSNAKVAITCCSLVPTRRTSWQKKVGSYDVSETERGNAWYENVVLTVTGMIAIQK